MTSRCSWTANGMAVTLALTAVGCGDEAPTLPPADSMQMLAFGKGNPSGALSSGDQAAGTTANIDQAVLAVGFVVVAVDLALLVPRAVFATVITEKPTQSGDKWIWKHTYPLLGWEAELHGKAEDKLELEMHITGLRAGDNDWVNDYVWYTGGHAATSGEWAIYNPGTKDVPGPTVPVVTIDWSRASDTDRSITFNNVTPDSPKNGDTLAFTLNGPIASMTLHDAMSMNGQTEDGPTQDFSVAWSVADGSGKLTRVSGETLCWDTLANGQVDIACPAGDWPNP